MSEKSSEETSEKKHKATQKRLLELKKEGNFLRAKEFYSGFTLIAALILFYCFTLKMYESLSHNFFTTYSRLHLLIFEPESTRELIKHLALNNLIQLMPFFIGILIFFFLSVYLMGGLKFSKKLIAFKGERLSVVKNIKRIFSLQNAVEVGKSILKVVLFLSILFTFIYIYHNDILNLAKIGEKQVIYNTLALLSHYFIYLIFGIIVIASIDGAFNYYNYNKKAMMTDKELKDESKETDGSPEVKKKQRQTQQAIALQGLQQDIPKASVVVTNPTHFAVALRYNEDKDKAPKIIAKGADHMAFHIRTIAKKHNVPIYESPSLARAIYYTGDLGSYIHPELYMAVAMVLSYIMQLETYQAGQGEFPNPVEDLQIPDEFHF